ncbi:hypothetical protein [Thalassotalea atypica]|uniref:hypothetical protein n=1 Tax=Thalassotalea atypica TaxID=2054316 RepID=UPI002572D1F0|nr:hypothetical protein [Thalassotalea atypica]
MINKKWQKRIEEFNFCVTLAGGAISAAFALYYLLAHPDDIAWQFYSSCILIFISLYQIRSGYSFRNVVSWTSALGSIFLTYLSVPYLWYGIKEGLNSLF